MTEIAASSAPAPKLLKARMRHTYWFMTLSVLTLLFCETGWPEDGLVHEPLEWLGYVLVIFGVLGRVYSSVYIGGRKNDEVVQDGPFSVVRNPLYVFSFIAVIGIGLQTATFAIPALLAAIFIFYYPFVVAREEAFLLHKFGQPYEEYTKLVPRWIPNFSLWRQPEEINSRPKFVLKTLLDAAVFFIAFPALELLSHLHQSGVLPVLVYLR